MSMTDDRGIAPSMWQSRSRDVTQGAVDRRQNQERRMSDP